jgi:hypothetical protein
MTVAINDPWAFSVLCILILSGGAQTTNPAGLGGHLRAGCGRRFIGIAQPGPFLRVAPAAKGIQYVSSSRDRVCIRPQTGFTTISL